jgi:hypothetical protein
MDKVVGAWEGVGRMDLGFLLMGLGFMFAWALYFNG